MDYYIHYMDGTTEVQHWCDECDEREALFFHHDHQYCGQCNEKEIQDLLQDLDNYNEACTHDWHYIDEEVMECSHCNALQR